MAAFTVAWWAAVFGLWRGRRWGRVLANGLAALLLILVLVQFMSVLFFALGGEGELKIIGMFFSVVLIGVPSAVVLLLALISSCGIRQATEYQV